MGNVFPTARLTTTWMPTAGAEVGGATLSFGLITLRFFFLPPLLFFIYSFLFLLSLPQLLRLLLGTLGIPVLPVSWWAPPASGPVCGGLWGGSLRSGQHLPQ